MSILQWDSQHERDEEMSAGRTCKGFSVKQYFKGLSAEFLNDAVLSCPTVPNLVDFVQHIFICFCMCNMFCKFYPFYLPL